MKKMLAIIAILAIILLGMVFYKNTAKITANQVNVQEINEIEEYIYKIYMWKEVTNEALPTFEDINQADETWIWEVVKKNIEEYELDKEQIQEKAEELFGESFQKQFPDEGNQAFEYDEESGKYLATEINLDEQEDSFLLDKIEKTKEGYQVEIIEYLEDYSEMQNIKIRNLQAEEIGSVGSTESESKIQEIVKSYKDRFNKKQITLKKDENNNLYVITVSQ